MFEDIFLRKKAIPEKLEAYGFQKLREGYRYAAEVLHGEFRLEVTVGKTPVPETRLTEIAAGEEYILYKTDAAGTFVGEVREAVANVLQEIADRCYETAVFRAEQTARLLAYVRETYGDEPEYLWENFPDNAVLRRKDTGKWYGVILTVSRRKLGLPSEEAAEILDLRTQPENMEELIDRTRFFPGWHMNKKHWYTVVLDGTVPFEEISRRVDESYLLAKGK